MKIMNTNGVKRNDNMYMVSNDFIIEPTIKESTITNNIEKPFFTQILK